MDPTTFDRPLTASPPPPVSREAAPPGELLEVPDGASSSRDTGPIRRQPPEPLVVGEIRQNLDDLKAAVLSYYSRLYSFTGRSIDERLDRLAASPFSNTVKAGRLPLAANARSRPTRQPGVAVPPPNTCFDFLAEEQKCGSWAGDVCGA